MSGGTADNRDFVRRRLRGIHDSSRDCTGAGTGRFVFGRKRAAHVRRDHDVQRALATVTNADAMTAVLGGLAANGVLMVIGAAGPLSVDPILLISGRRSVKGWYSGTSIDSQDTLKFSALAGVQSMNEIFPLERASEAYERMMSGKARFRVVLSMESWKETPRH